MMVRSSLTGGVLPRAPVRALLIFCALAVLLASAPAGFAADYFVDQLHPQAADENAGTSEEAPWLTLVQAVETAAAGDTVWIKSGVYTETNHMLFGSTPAP